MFDILLQCRFDMQNFKGKSVTILKLLIRAIYCRQAETHSSIRLDSTSKRVRTVILRLVQNCEEALYFKMAIYSLPRHSLIDASGF